MFRLIAQMKDFSAHRFAAPALPYLLHSKYSEPPVILSPHPNLLPKGEGDIESPLLFDTLIPAFSRGEKEILRGFLNIHPASRPSGRNDSMVCFINNHYPLFHSSRK